MFTRASGLLLHITSLPSRYGIGDLGPAAYAFARLLRDIGQLYWQFLPLGPTSPAIGNSPYSSCSAFAGNPLLISPEKMVDDGLLSWADIEGTPAHAPDRVDFETVEHHRARVLRAAFERNRHWLEKDHAFSTFCQQASHWLQDYVRFVTIKQQYGGSIWSEWPEPLRYRDENALAEWDAAHREDLLFETFVQYLFFRQWHDLRTHCNDLGVRLIGDVPIYVTYDSADVWTHPQFFKLDENRAPISVAGVPPDYFSRTGQRWGNPVYDWNALSRDGFSWWIRRMAHNFSLTDLARIDHFRGFAGYWEIPAEEETAIHGKWVDAPGMQLFSALSRNFTVLPLIAEDLGIITPDVRELKAAFNLPGMKVLQFGFGGDNLIQNPDAPMNHEKHCILYTGTHDNSPMREWFANEAGEQGRENFSTFAGHAVSEASVAETAIRIAMSSVANTAIFPVQDVLGLDGSARMNTPSVAKGNWEWRLRPEEMELPFFKEFARMTQFFGRRI